ncbi:hypothetical protein [Alicyclobacillus dauci]|uniref:Flagellar operon protein n=1 Tax=Alicyclobacillus dauci TaxID=1475485 RepID=A0ABY6YXQ1_9BACL|nr:hypothetical protein [Alicyclobacillus dauci]WAH35400.1 hypothetical protein NZD86_13950 [Alicyclobacillus dauci]
MSDIRNTISNWRPFDTQTKVTSAKSSPFPSTFQTTLNAAADRQASQWNISQHAQQRLQQRGITLSNRDLLAMDKVATQAEAKGAKNAYMVLGQTGLVVNLPSRTVVTAMDHRTDTVITQIDSVVFV